MNLKTKFLRALFVLVVLSLSLKAYISSATTTDTTQLTLLERESDYEKDKAKYLQEYVLDKILGPGNAVVIVDVVLGKSVEIKSVGILYAANYPTDGPTNTDSTGEIVISNGTESAVPKLEWTHESTEDNTAVILLTPMISGNDLILRVENLSGHTLEFGINVKYVMT